MTIFHFKGCPSGDFGPCDCYLPTEAAVTEVIGMTPKQYKTIIDQLGLSQERAAEWLGVSARTGQNYAAKGPPEPVAKLLRLMVKLELKPEDVK